MSAQPFDPLPRATVPDDHGAIRVEALLRHQVWRRLRRRSVLLGLLSYLAFVSMYVYLLFGGPYEALGLPRQPLYMIVIGIIAAMIGMSILRRIVGFFPARAARKAARKCVISTLGNPDALGEAIEHELSRWWLWSQQVFIVEVTSALKIFGQTRMMIVVRGERTHWDAPSTPHVFEPVLLDEADPHFVDTTRLLEINKDSRSWFDTAPAPLRRVVKNLTVGGSWFYLLLLGYFLIDDVREFVRTRYISTGGIITLVMLGMILLRPLDAARGGAGRWFVLPGGILLRGEKSRLVSRRNGVVTVRQMSFGRWLVAMSYQAGDMVYFHSRLLTRVEASVLVSAWCSQSAPIAEERLTELMSEG